MEAHTKQVNGMQIFLGYSEQTQIVKIFSGDTEVTVKADARNGRIYWMSDWTVAWDLLKEGYFTARTHRHLMGHTDFFLVKR